MQSRCSKEIKVVKGEITRNVFAKVFFFLRIWTIKSYVLDYHKYRDVME